MQHNDIAAQLAATMQDEGYELDACDRLIIRQTLARALTAQRRRAERERSASTTYTWNKPSNPRRR
ncbi:hypothetical protein NG99_21280 [Erwinia typographi]|uniref:Uncharacterized protein n=1 Tax=Erwinia typographi TaxID=371042 RepID=A0A0A3YRY8_9GAMM|nr:hypothetical protein [Erwinia typographi]KGT88294.1 hypothetical protein NG99_21280 [Erwinia typographi]